MTKEEKSVVSFYRAEKKPTTTTAAPDSELQGKLDALTAERDELQHFSDEAQRIFTPVAGDSGKDESGLEAMQRIVGERNYLKSEVKRLQDIIDVGKPANESLMKERAALELKVVDLTKERDAAQQALADGKVIPADALKRITDVNGVGDKLAPKILAALTGE